MKKIYVAPEATSVTPQQDGWGVCLCYILGVCYSQN